MKPLKQALVADLTAALAPVLAPAAPDALPKGIAHAVEDLADRILRWRASQQRTARPAAARDRSSESDALARLMDGHLQQDEAAAGVTEAIAVAPAAPETVLLPPASTGSPEQAPPERKRRPRLPR